MRFQALLVGLALLAVAISGCTSPDDSQPANLDQTTADPADTTGTGDVDAPETEGTTSETGEGTANETEETVDENVLPQATLEADNPTGEAPMDVTFTIDATDEDGDELTWTLDVDGDSTPDAEGAELPATYTHTYEEGFTGNASLVVSDGTEEVATAIALDISDIPAPETFTWECTVQVPAVVLGISGLPITYGGCELGTLEADAVFVGEEADTGCGVRYEEPGPTTTTLIKPEPGEVYPAGTVFAGRCDAPNGALPNSTIVGEFSYLE